MLAIITPFATTVSMKYKMASRTVRGLRSRLTACYQGPQLADCVECLGGGGVLAGSRDRVALPISGDNPKAKEIVAQLLDRFGFDSVDAGTIAESWRQQPRSPVYCTNPTKEELQKWLKNVDRSSLGTKREEGMKAHFAVEQRDPRTGALIKRADYQTAVNAHRSVHPEIMNSK